MRRAARTGAVALLWAALVLGQQIEPAGLLSRAKTLVNASVINSSRYVCTEEIERSWYGLPKPMPPNEDLCRPARIGSSNKPLSGEDRLRLDVGVVSGRETFAWHDAAELSTNQIDSVVTSGPTSSGLLIGLLEDVFLLGHAVITYHGTRVSDGREEAEYQYVVLQIVSRFRTSAKNAEAPIGYKGSFTIDPQSAQLTSITVDSTAMPEGAYLCSAHIDIRYQLVPVHDMKMNLPSFVETDSQQLDAVFTKSKVRFSRCHEFQTSSTLRFDAPQPAAPTVQMPPDERGFPPNLVMTIRLNGVIDSDTSWAGDRVEGAVEGNVTWKHQLLIPKGTLISGRLMRLEHDFLPNKVFRFSLRFDTVHDGSRTYPINLALFIPTIARPGLLLLTSPFYVEQAGSGKEPQVIGYQGKHLRLNNNFETAWITK